MIDKIITIASDSRNNRIISKYRIKITLAFEILKLRLLRKIRYDIEKDLLEKITAWDVELENEEIERRKQEIDNKTFDPHCEGQRQNCTQKMRPLLDTDLWLSKAKRVFAEAEKQRQNSSTLSSIANAALGQGKEELINIKIAADDSFKERINELRDHKVNIS